MAVLDPNPFNDSKSEIKAIEGARYGVPLIATNVGCYDELIVNGETGYLIDPSNPKKEWMRVLSKCIKDPQHVKEMGRNLKLICDDLYDINKIVKGRLDLYQQLMGLKKEAMEKSQGYNRSEAMEKSGLADGTVITDPNFNADEININQV
jgi:hypothetical protein